MIKNIVFTGNNIYILQKGVYYIYCNLRVGLKYIEEVSIKMGNKILFSTTLNSFQASNASYHDVNLNGLAYLSEGDKLYVQVKPRNTKNIATNIADLFPYARNTPEMQKNDNFGLFMVSKHDVSWARFKIILISKQNKLKVCVIMCPHIVFWTFCRFPFNLKKKLCRRHSVLKDNTDEETYLRNRLSLRFLIFQKSTVNMIEYKKTWLVAKTSNNKRSLRNDWTKVISTISLTEFCVSGSFL